jgi:dTDP-4-amino-4,6-dideoxygalactose transaminase
MIPHSRPSLDQNDYDAVLQVLKSGHIVQGEWVDRLEQTMAVRTGVRGGAAVSSGTAALHLALLSLGIQKGDEVILPSFVCSAPFHAVSYTGAAPVIADIDRLTFNIDPRDLPARINPKTKAIIVPHMFGMTADMDEICAFGIPVIEDCAHSLGGRYKGSSNGSFGDISIFSFYATKMIASGEGGLILSNSESILECIRDLRDYDEKETLKVRYNYKMTDLEAALGFSQLKKLSSFIEARKIITARYSHEFQTIPIRLPFVLSDRDHVYYRFVILCDGAEDFIERMKKAGVSCRKPVFKPLHRYLGLPGYENTEWVWERAVSIPLYPSLTEDEISGIIDAVKSSGLKHV